MLEKLFSPPVFSEDEEKTKTARLLYQIIIAISGLFPLALVISFINPDASRFILPAGIGLFVVLAILMVLNQSGRTRTASIFLVASLALIFTYFNYITAGEPRPIVLLSISAIIMAGLLLGERASLVVATYLSVQQLVMIYLNTTGIIKAQGTGTPLTNTIVIIASYLLIGHLFRLAISRLQVTLNQVRKSEQNLQASNRDLTDMTATLEQRVADRTQEIERQQQQADRRSRQFEGIVRVSKAISTRQNLQEVLPQITELISEQFNYYHVGIFLNDSFNQYAILSAANSEGGKKMLARGHQLKIGEQGIVGYVTATGNPRIALDVGMDIVHFNNPDLPLTHSEMALPLKSGTEVIGSLDIQSVEQNAFTQEDIEVLQSLADQVSLAIQNTRLFDQTSRLLAEAEAFQKQYQRDVWKRLSRKKKITGFKYTITGATALEEHETGLSGDGVLKKEVSIPISLRGENIGTLIVQVPRSEKINTDQMDLIKAVAERVALSAENARLFEETNQRAEREQVISDIAAKISTSVRTENILKTTAKELNQLLDGAEVLIKLGTDRNQ